MDGLQDIHMQLHHGISDDADELMVYVPYELIGIHSMYNIGMDENVKMFL